MDLRIGSVVATMVGPFRHVGLVVAFNHWGEAVILSNSMRAGGVVRETLPTFAASSGRFSIDTSLTPKLPIWQVVARAESKEGTRYAALNWNCEHFVRFALGHPIESPQAQGWTAAAGIVALVLFL